MLTQKQLKELFNYDPITGVFIRKRFSRKAGWSSGNPGTGQRLVIMIKGKKYFVHKLAWLYMYGEYPVGKVDHKNRNGLDNCIDNPRLATNSQDGGNRSLNSNNSSGYKGVTAFYGKWMANITINRKRHYLGLFDNIENAATAYSCAADKFFGEFSHYEGKCR